MCRLTRCYEARCGWVCLGDCGRWLPVRLPGRLANSPEFSRPGEAAARTTSFGLTGWHKSSLKWFEALDTPTSQHVFPAVAACRKWRSGLPGQVSENRSFVRRLGGRPSVTFIVRWRGTFGAIWPVRSGTSRYWWNSPLGVPLTASAISATVCWRLPCPWP
jgi:hypothetical protein